MSTKNSKTPRINKHEWFVIDAEGQVLGRLATEVARRLRGKHKPEYAVDSDHGDYIIIVNAEKIRVTGNKAHQKTYYRHTGYPGGLKTINFEKLIAYKPERVIELAVKGMMPRNPLGRAMQQKLKVYAGQTHPHEAQQPQSLKF